MDQTPQPLVIKTTPLVFVRRLIYIELVFLLIFFGIRFILSSENIMSLAPSITLPSSFFLTILLSILQVLIIILAFITWYSERYIITSSDIRYKRSDIFHERAIIKLKGIDTISVEQGSMGKWFNYGSLVINDSKSTAVNIGNVPNPDYYATLLTTMSVSDGEQKIIKPIQSKSLKTLLSTGENNQIEYKSSFQWDYKKQEKNKDLHKPVMKTIVAFMNAMGGTLIIGISDKGEVLGLEKDFQLLKKKNSDGFENSFTMVFKKTIGDEYHYLVEIKFKLYKKKTVAILTIQPAPEPVYIKFHDKEEFYIRAGNSSQPLSIRQATSYIRSRFSS